MCFNKFEKEWGRQENGKKKSKDTQSTPIFEGNNVLAATFVIHLLISNVSAFG